MVGYMVSNVIVHTSGVSFSAFQFQKKKQNMLHFSALNCTGTQ
ncbi:unnamed protein product [Staurois parvus]|uniref:Uncharacterized protein n=1 Tax=Staurois parvus TaxID=386267 RepID=A0ABN9F1M1_9NEOB|nr:unnamed protein product [Staurois parvus]